jgi:hypothetical protein
MSHPKKKKAERNFFYDMNLSLAVALCVTWCDIQKYYVLLTACCICCVVCGSRIKTQTFRLVPH